VLEVEGVGYRAEMDGKNLALFVGYSHPVKMEPPAGISFETERRPARSRCWASTVKWSGKLPRMFASVRPPEPYHGKGIRYAGERIRRKAGKAGKEPSKPWLIKIVPWLVNAATCACRKHMAGTAQRPRLNVFKSLSAVSMPNHRR
jgi:hypothetical protein